MELGVELELDNIEISIAQKLYHSLRLSKNSPFFDHHKKFYKDTHISKVLSTLIQPQIKYSWLF